MQATTEKKAAAPTNGTKTEEIKRQAREVFLCDVPPKRFKNEKAAVDFLNSPEAVGKNFFVIKGNVIEKKQKVTLR